MRWLLFRLNIPRVALYMMVVSVIFLCAGCSHYKASIEGVPAESDIAAVLNGASIDADQMVVVAGEGGSSSALLWSFERAKGRWQLRQGPLHAMVGRNGFAAFGAKVEGDGKSPTGLFPLEFVFGYAPDASTKMPYRQAGEDDVWVDDQAAGDYNTWTRRKETSATSYENMRLPDIRYRHGVVIGYNRNPIVKGMGSAIFMHAWLEEGRPTAGCVSLEESQLVDIIGWLDPAARPKILMGNREDLAAALKAGQGWRK